MPQKSVFVAVSEDSRLVDGLIACLPHTMRLDLSDEDPAVLDAEMLYRLPKGLERLTLVMPRYALSYVPADGSVTRLAFRRDRPKPEGAYDELFDAFKAIGVFAENLGADAPHRLGLLVFGKTLLRRWLNEPAYLRTCLVPPFPNARV